MKTQSPKAPLTLDINTPEKPIQLPRRSRNRGFALSVKEVKKVALGLRSSAASRSNSLASDESLASEIGLSPRRKPSSSKAKAVVKLPENYEMLCEFFNSMDSSIRLLRLKGSMTSFRNICTSIKHLTERRFTYKHLAQLMHILPEAISIKKVLLRDEATCCMKPELQVNLNAEAIYDINVGKNESSSSVLRKIFRERLVDFYKSHPEGEEIPEEPLPYPFSKERPSLDVNESAVNSSTSVENPVSSAIPKPISAPSHLPGSFQKRFSARLSNSNPEKTELLCSRKENLGHEDSVSVALSPLKSILKPPVARRTLRSRSLMMATPSKCENSGMTTPNKCENSGKPEQLDSDTCKDVLSLDGTPAKQVLTPSRLMTATPDIMTPKRYRADDVCDSPLATKSAKRSTRTKLFMTPTKGASATEKEFESKSSSYDDDDVLNILPESLLQSIKEKEKKAIHDRDTGVVEAIKRQKSIASLPNIFNMVLLIFQSFPRSVMTKNELIHKLISSNCKVVDKGEVEEQLQLLQEIIPDWFLEKVSYSGDILCSINKVSSPEDIRRRLAEAK